MHFFSLALFVTIGQCYGDLSARDYVYWKKADIEAWHQYFPSRSLTTEYQTNSAALQAALRVAGDLRESLRRLVTYQSLELQTAEIMMQGTSAQGCISGIAADLDNAIAEAVSEYNDCTADVPSILQRQSANLSKISSNYQTVYQNTLTGMDNCARTYPNKDSKNRLNNCVDSWNNNYFSAANGIMMGVTSSPSMQVFTSKVVVCVETAAQQVVERGWQFLTNLVKCSKLSENIDWQAYENEVTAGFYDYLTDFNLADQVSGAQFSNNLEVSSLEREMLEYYSLKKNALEQYVIESRGQSFYASQLRGILSSHYASVSQALYDNPANSDCADQAFGTLNSAVQTESLEALSCDQYIVNDTITRLDKVNSDFEWINNYLPVVGNYAILDCFSRGYIFMEGTISKCYALEWSRFTVSSSSLHSNIVHNVATLVNYRDNFFGNSSSIPCGDTVVPSTLLWADQALYDMERCLYIDSGAKYEITTTPSATTLSPPLVPAGRFQDSFSH